MAVRMHEQAVWHHNGAVAVSLSCGHIIGSGQAARRQGSPP
jgi:hypothetical protein